VARGAKEKIGKAILWIGCAGFLLCFAGIFVTDAVLMGEPRVPQASTGHVIEWNFKGYVRYITPAEDRWQQDQWMPLDVMFFLVALGAYLTPDKNEKWLKIFKRKY
jgi:hypothetical protein